jgi:hypothetical protein
MNDSPRVKAATKEVLFGVRLALQQLEAEPSKRTDLSLLAIFTGLLLAMEISQGIIPPPSEQKGN